MKRLFLNVILVFLFVSCSQDDDNANNFKIETLPVNEVIVPEEFTFGSRHDITITYDLPRLRTTYRVVVIHFIIYFIDTKGLLEL